MVKKEVMVQAHITIIKLIVTQWVLNLRWLVRNGFQNLFLRPIHWDKFKRCIPPHQLEKYVKNGAIVLWTVTTGDIKDNQVEIKGWNWCHEVKEYGVFRQTICANIWLQEDDKMRSLDNLLKNINI